MLHLMQGPRGPTFATMDNVVGNRLRQARVARQLSLNDVAERAKISVATLSRIERDKQGIDVGLFLTLSKILRSTAHELLADASATDKVDPLAVRIAGLDPTERARLWRELTDVHRNYRVRNEEGRLAISASRWKSSWPRSNFCTPRSNQFRSVCVARSAAPRQCGIPDFVIARRPGNSSAARSRAVSANATTSSSLDSRGAACRWPIAWHRRSTRRWIFSSFANSVSPDMKSWPWGRS